MKRVVVVTTAETGTVDAAHALEASVAANWGDAEVRILVSSRVERPPSHWNVTSIQDVHGTPFVASRILRESDQLALSLPKLLSVLLDEYETCLLSGPGDARCAFSAWN